MSASELSPIISEFESQRSNDLTAAVNYLTSDVAIVKTLRRYISAQIVLDEFDPSLFQWLYSCVQQRKENRDLYTFVVQFTLDIILVYLHSVYETIPEVKASSEALLMILLSEARKDPPPPLEILPLSKPSVYHQLVPLQLSQPSLTEAMLQRHNESETSSVKPMFSGKQINVNNRLSFLSGVIDVFSDRLMLCPAISKIAFCNGCVRLCLQGAPLLCVLEDVRKHSMASIGVCNLQELGNLRRYSVNDELLTRLLHAVRMCLFHSCHKAAMQALYCLKARAEYELLTVSMQVSAALVRLSLNVIPTSLNLDSTKSSTYVDDGKTVDPSVLHVSLQSHILKLKQNKHFPEESSASR